MIVNFMISMKIPVEIMCVCVGDLFAIIVFFLCVCVFQAIGRKSFRSTSVQTSCHRLMVEQDVNQTLTAQIM